MRAFFGHLQKVKAFALGQIPAGRQMTVYPGDLFIVSYPRSGNTWTRFLIGNLIYQDTPVTFANVEQLVPSIYVYPDWKLRRLPRIFKSHDCFDPRYQNLIYIVRDPRDVAVSAYYYSLKVRLLPDTCPIEEFIPLFMSGTFGSGLLADPRWGSWHDNVASWLAMRGNRKFLLLRYEDMIEKPDRELHTIAEFLNIEASGERISRAIELSSASRMRELEQKQGTQWQLTKGTRRDLRFVRNAGTGGWTTALPAKSVTAIEQAWGPLMETLGYALTTVDAGPRVPA
jgi:Sulfotransferase domain